MTTPERHSLLRRLSRRYLDPDADMEGLEPFLDAIDEALKQADADRLMLERSMDLSSRELIQANQEMRAVFLAFPDLFFRINREGVILESRGGTEDDLFLPIHRLKGKRLQDIPNVGVGSAFADAIEQAQGSNELVSFDYSMEADGARRYYEARLMPFSSADEAVVMVRNISDLRRIERLRTHQSGILSAIAAGAPTDEVLRLAVGLIDQQAGLIGSVFLLDPDRFTLHSAATYQLPDFYCEAIDGMRIGPDIASCGAACYSRQRTVVEDIQTHPNWVPYRELASQAELAACWSEPIIDSSGTVQGTLAIYSRSVRGPGEYESELMRTAARLAAIALEKEQAELRERSLNTQLARAERIESVGVLAAGVAHDLNNILGPVVAYPDLMLDMVPPESEFVDLLGQIRDSAMRAAAVIQDLLTLARRGTTGSETVAPCDVIDEYVGSAGFRQLRERRPDVEVTVGCADDLPTISGTGRHLSQAIMNLALNAFEAMPSGGALSIEAHLEYVEEPVRGYDSVSQGDYVVISVSDTGRGIAREDLDHVFEPFYSKKTLGLSGSGLGLAVVYGVVKDFHGYIDVDTELGRGTAFKLYFPVSQDESPSAETPLTDASGTESILVVDDERRQRELADKLLSSLGYTVTTANGGRAAVEFLKQASVDLVVLDMVMEEGFDGLDTYREIIELHPGQPCVIASGFSETDRVREAQELGAGEYVRKPYTMESIGAAVRRQLDEVAARKAAPLG